MRAEVGHPALDLDRRAFGLLETTRGSFVARSVKLLAELGPPLAVLFVVALLVILGMRRRWAAGSVLAAGYPLVVVVVHLAKAADTRPRPSGLLIRAGGYSFPSAQAALSIGLLAIAVAITSMAGRRAGRVVIGVAVLLIPLIGALLISVRVHYLTDVLAGWGLGAAVFALLGAASLAIGAARDRHGRALAR